jgi:hypothetical protein
MITILDPVPSSEVLKKSICRNCGVTLQYVPNDIKQGKSYDYTGDCDTYYFIPCLNCNHAVIVKRY